MRSRPINQTIPTQRVARLIREDLARGVTCKTLDELRSYVRQQPLAFFSIFLVECMRNLRDEFLYDYYECKIDYMIQHDPGKLKRIFGNDTAQQLIDAIDD